MKWELFTSALLRFRNLAFIISWLAIVGVLNPEINIEGFDQTPVILNTIGGLTYFGLVLQSMVSKNFQDEFLKRRKVSKIRRQNSECERFAVEVSRILNSKDYKNLKKIMNDKRELVKLYNSKDTYVNDDIVEKSINLVYTYIKVLRSYNIRSKDLKNTNLSEVTSRLANNNRKISFIKDEDTIESLKKLIECDERIIEKFKNEEKEIEKLKVKMEYMESTISVLKHQILTSFDTDEFIEKFDEAINEAEALGNALEVHRKNRVKL